MGVSATLSLPPPPEEQRWHGVPRPWWDAAGYAVAAVLLAAVGIDGLWNVLAVWPPETFSSWVTLLTALPACALVPAKVRAPRTALLAALVLFAVDVATAGGIVTLLVVLDALNFVVVHADASARRRILVAGSTIVAAGGALALAASGDARTALMIVLQWGAMGGMVYWYATAWQQSRDLVQLHRQAAADAAALAARDRDEAVHSERQRMARELHDLVAGNVAAVAIRTEAALATGDPAAHAAALVSVRDASLGAHDALRQMIGVLRDREAAGDGIGSARRADVPRLAEAARASGLTVSVADRVAGDLPAALDHAVGRIVQEGLANAARHSAGGSVEVRLDETTDGVVVAVLSRGGTALAAPALAGSGWGLELIRERVHALGGEVEAGPAGAGEWALRARLPRTAAT